MIVLPVLARRLALLVVATSIGACATTSRVQELETALSARGDSLTAVVARNDSLQAQVDALESEIERIAGLLRTGAATRP